MTALLRHVTESKLMLFVGKAGLTIFAFWFVLRGVDFASLQKMVKEQEWLLLAAVAALTVSQAVIGGVRWRMVLTALVGRGQPVMSVLKAIRICYIGNFFSCCLPGTLGGDVIRVWLAKSDHVPLSVAIHSVIIDRMIALVALALMVVATLPLLGALAGFDALALMPLVAALAVIGIGFLLHVDRWLAPFQQYSLARWLLYFVGSLKILFTHRLISAVSLLLALVGHSIYCLCAVILAYSLHASLTVLDALVLIPPVALAAVLPISIGGWGVREAAMVGMLALVGIPKAAALMLSVELGLLSLAANMPAGLLWLISRRTVGLPKQMTAQEIVGKS